MNRQYFVVFEEHDSIVVTVKEDVNRPNNPDCEQVLETWIIDHYGHVANYEYWEISTCEKYEI
ncbi:hypothetical protein [Bacillus sp. AG4(2022)]|uniref:hypothetical protein n=1 Tax=Bacillus sp. AG4(2022) TaxID=2962594 RepID=UPI0028815371|nr:hypothetical protein [Bacillus sp. AG4(2022)]MDT0160334.1 hypothetical protein [Bacillus sp. AG4(2022)]